uniref:CUB and zona pellucida-like domains 1, tandem duplicate 1 n=1 Tax=Pygocentrus nattereri TaxID=42514 RepID=A0AAR2KE35_PYGNA
PRGEFFSPQFPNNYPNNARCTWRLLASETQVVYLTFTFVQLETCCDSIRVYDGPTDSYPLLGRLPQNQTHHFNSSMRYLTVVSDGSVVARGFKAFFSSSLPENTGKLTRVACSSDSMTIVIERSYLNSLGISWQNLYVDDHRCRPSANSYEVSFNFPINLCGTNKTITRQVGEFLLSVKCHMEQGTTVGTVYKTKEIINHTIAGIGHFNASMAFYPSSSFSYPILEFPYEVSLNQYLYVQVQLSRADNTLDLLLDSCVASPNHDFQAHSYTLIQNGCVKDNTVYIYTNGRQYYAQFRFRAFKFLRTHSYVFLQCRVVVCADNDYNSRCRQGCRMRNRRSLDSAHHTETVTLGPITLKGQRAVSLHSFLQFTAHHSVLNHIG